MTDNTIRPGSRVTWFADSDYWGTVVDILPAGADYDLAVRWDNGLGGSYLRHQVRFRHNLAATLSYCSLCLLPLGAEPGPLHKACAGFGPQADKDRLEYLRGELRAERISAGELAELAELAGNIEPGDTELLEAAGVPEFPEDADLPYVVCDGKDVKAGEQTPVLGRFATEDEAAGFIGTLPEHLSGRYSLDGPSEDDTPPCPVCGSAEPDCEPGCPAVPAREYFKGEAGQDAILSRMLEVARGLTEPGEVNAEYERGMAELICETAGFSMENVPVIQAAFREPLDRDRLWREA
jgi:hypothetical protein